MTTKIRWMLLVGTFLALPAGCAAPPRTSGQIAPSINTPGFTGSTTIPGNNSTIASDAGATEQQQKWQLNRGR